ncbi:MAG: hypothetical protein ABII23_07495 [bacterium]
MAVHVYAGPRYHIIDPESLKGIFQDKKDEAPTLTLDMNKSSDKKIKHDEWNNFRRKQELGRDLSSDLWAPYQIKTTSSTLKEAEQDKTKRAFDVELAYESGLSIQGLKTIDVSFSHKKFLNEPADGSEKQKNLNEFDMEQTLRVDIQGKVGRKISVDVHFDDTQDNKRDISVLYKGDPDEVVQEAAFGDITLSLPHTEFVNYNKQVFGIKADLKYKMARFMAIGSRTKGITETKVYTGQTQLVKEEIIDKNYVARKYYKPFDADIKRETITIWQDDQSADNNQAKNSSPKTYERIGLTGAATGYFDELKAGVNYSFDPIANVITFRSNIPDGYVIIIDYQKADETWLHERSSNGSNLIILKDAANTEGITRELKNYYQLKQSKILHDNNRGNFTFQIQEMDKTIPTVLNPGGKPVPKYPADVEVDFDDGIFFFKNASTEFPKPFPDNVYSLNVNRYQIFVEYQYRVKLYNLRPNLVPGSERIVLDGKTLTRDIDYFLDYDSGFLTFYDEEIISDNSKIEITYEYAPFGGQFGQTLVGSRLELSPIEHFFIGSSVLYNFSAKPAQVPDMRSQPDSTMVWDVDSRIEDITFGDFPFKINMVKGEFAQSIYNPNIFGKAIVESMEGVKQDDTLSLGEDFWMRASNPNSLNLPSARMQYNAVSWSNADVKTEEIYLQLGATEKWWEDEDEQQILAVNYDFTKTDADEVSLLQVVSKGGLDYSEKIFLEFIYFDDGFGQNIRFDIGEVSEDLDSDGVQLETEDANRNGTLDKDEDIGWGFSYPGLADVPIEADNSRIDREDLDGDGLFDGGDPLSGDSYEFVSEDNAEWKYKAIELKITDPDSWKKIKHLRLTISKGGSTPDTGTIRIARIGIVGNRFENPAVTTSGTASMIVSAINNQDNQGYDSLIDHPVYKEIYPDAEDQKKEQALEITYKNFTGSDSGSTRIGHQAPLGFDFTQHKKLKFFVYNNDANKKTIFIQFGTEATYFEFIIPIPADSPNRWEMYEIILDDVNNDGVADRMVYGNTSKQGDELGRPSTSLPSLKSISQIKIGVRDVEGSAQGSFWINEFFVDTAYKRVGQAGTFSGDFEVPKWTTFGGTYREIDRNFRTITSAVTNQDRFDESGYFKFSRLSFMPMDFTASKSRTITPSAIESDTSGLISVLAEGEVVTESYAGNTTISIRHLPQITGKVSRKFTDSTNLKRRDIDESASGSLSYTNPLQTPILHLFPSTISGSYSRTNYRLEHSSPTSSQIDSLEYTDKYTGSLTFSPWNNFTIKPSYSLSTVREIKFIETPDQETHFDLQPDESHKLDIPKSLTQNVKGDVNITLLRWLRPAADYSHNVNVNYDITSSTSVTTKTINRTSNGKVSWTFEPRNFYGLSGFQPVKTLSISSSYSISDGDTYENIPRSLYVQESIWVRKPLKPEYDLSKSTETLTNNPNIAHRKSLSIRDTQNYTARWKPLDWIPWLKGPFNPIKTISTTNTLTQSKEETDTTGTIKKVFSKTWPNIDVSMSDFEKLIYAGWFMQNTRVNGKVFKKVVETVNTSENIERKQSGNVNFKLIKYFDMYVTYEKSRSETFNIDTSSGSMGKVLDSLSNSVSRSAQMGFNISSWRFTPSYSETTNKVQDRTGNFTTDKISKSSLLKIRGDFHKPKNFRIPFTSIGFLLKNRMIFDTSLSWDTVRSPVLEFKKDNTNTGKLQTSVDYELSQNLRVKFGLSGSMFRNKEKNDDDYNEYAGSAGLTIQF